MKRAVLSPLVSRTRTRTALRLRATTPRPPATLRTLATSRATRHAYFNALCAFVSPAR